MAGLGAKVYRFSVSWPRVQPNGTGAANERGLDFYDRLVDALLAAGIKPLVNLFHWDLPQALQDQGGFANPRVVGWFTDYAALVASRLGDRVSDWMTFNEPAVFAFLGHADGIHAPGLRDWPTALRVADNQLRAHAAASAAIRSLVEGRADRRRLRREPGRARDRHGARPARRGAVERRPRRVVPRSAVRPRLSGAWPRGAPGRGSPRGRRAGRAAGGRPRLPGPELLPARLASGRGRIGPFDWTIGAVPARSRRRWTGRSRPTACATRCSTSTASTRRARSWSPRTAPRTRTSWSRTAASATTDRRRYLARHVAAAADALAAGVPLTGYHVWSLLDNYEWSLGYSRRFGVVHVDFATQRRTPKDSARWYRRPHPRPAA